MLAFDECHCISEWGLDFRPSYRQVGSLSAVIEAPVLCLTGTTTSQIKVDVEKILKIKDVYLVIILPDRPEIHINVIKPATNDKYKELVEWLSEMIATAHTRCKKILLFSPL